MTEMSDPYKGRSGSGNTCNSRFCCCCVLVGTAVQPRRVQCRQKCTIIQDSVDKLAVLRHIKPVTYEGCSDAEMIVSADVRQAVEHRPPEKPLKEQRNRQFALQMISELLAELQEQDTVQSLLLGIQAKMKRKANLHDIIVREEEGRHRVRALQAQLVDIHQEYELELQREDEMIALAKDQLLEMKAKAGLEGKYMKNSAELQVYQDNKIITHTENELQASVQHVQDKIDEVTRVQTEMEKLLKEQQQIRVIEELEMCVECYERDTEDKQQEINLTKSSKTRNLTSIQGLAQQYREGEQLVIEDHVEKETARRLREQEATESSAAVKIQSWWRGTLVRRGLGPFKKGKKGKAKGKEKGKKKKK